MQCLRSVGFVLAIFLAVTGSFLAPARAEPSGPGADDVEFFERRVRPVLAERCYECHSARGKAIKGGLQLDRRTTFLAGGESGPAVVAGKPDASLLIQAVRFAPGVSEMPPSGKLPAAEIAVLVEWVRRGAPFPADATPDPTGSSAPRTASSIDFAAGKQHWAFQPLRATNPPPSATEAASREAAAGLIDRFLLAAQAAQKLAPSPPADRRTLLRRVMFDLLGLPPTPEEVADFVADPAPDAYERLVDRCLASPHYGERWGRYWLDLVRYCDVPESWAVEKDAAAWPYRDWVVDALNRDVPYDRFVTLQLAADQLPETAPADIAALGFLGLSPSYWKELKLDPAVIRSTVAEEWEERLHTFGSTLLGLTIDCARCHDHKLDPISQHDYYALAGVFASTRLLARPIVPAPMQQSAVAARQRLDDLQKKRTALLKETSAESRATAEQLAAEIEQLERATPHLRTPLAYAATDASLHVLPDGPQRTKLEYRPAPLDLALQIRGNPAKPGPIVPRRFLTVLSPSDPAPFRQGSGRRELAESVFRDAGPLAARVIVNRVWKYHFGRGLVDTPSNFGLLGARPTHPELLDDLAARFIAAGWSLKWLHREILLTATYRQSAAPSESKQALDPDNRWLWRMSPRRLDIEVWRDAMLSVAGRLDRRIGGADIGLDDGNNRRRTLYATIRRREVHAMLRLYDFPDPTTHSASRDATTTPAQQLFVLNSPLLLDLADALATRVRSEASTVDEQIHRVYALLYGRAPSSAEADLGRAFLSEPGGAAVWWPRYAQVLLGGNELAFIE